MKRKSSWHVYSRQSMIAEDAGKLLPVKINIFGMFIDGGFRSSTENV